MRAGEARPVQPDPAVVQAGLLELTRELQGAVDGAGRLQFVNAALAGSLGIAPAALLGSALLERVAPEDRPRVQRHLREAADAAAPVEWECGWCAAAGPRRVAWRACRQPGGGLVLLAGQDVTAAQQTAAELGANRRLLQAICDTLPHSLVVKDRESNYVLGNRAWAERFGVPPEALLGKNPERTVERPEAERLDSLALDRRTLSSQQARVETDVVRTARNGELRTFHAWRSPLRDADGQVIGLLSISEDVTERRREERALQESERRFRTLIEASIQGIVILRGRKPFFANPSYARTFGYDSPEEIVALDTVDCLVAPQDVARQTDYGKARLRGEDAPSQYEFQGVRKDGTRIWLDCIVRVVDWEGEPAVLATLLDITARKRAEQQLRASQRLLQTVFDTVPHLLFVKDLDGTYLMANAAWLHHHGRGPEAMVGRHTLELEHRPLADRKAALEIDRQVLAGGRMIEVEYERTVVDGSLRHFRNFRAPLRDEHGAVIGIVGISEDITDRRRAEEELRASQRLLRLVLDNLPHNVFVKDLDGRYVMANRAMAEFHNLALEELPGRRVQDLPGPLPEQIAMLAETDRQVLAADRLLDWPDVPITNALGQERVHNLHKVTLHDSQGRVQGILCVAEDVTELKRAEEELRASQRLLRLVTDAVPHNIYVKDLEGRFLLVNRAMADFHSVSPEAMVGKRTAEMPAPRPEQARQLAEMEREVLQAGHMLHWPRVPVSNAAGTLTIRSLHKLPLRDEAGRIQAIVGISEDITQEVRTEQELRASHRLLRTVIDTIPSLVTVKDSQRRYLLVNKAWSRSYDIPAERALGRSVAELGIRPAADMAVVERMDDAILKEGRAEWDQPFSTTLPDGSRRHFLTYRAPLLDDANAVTGVVVASLDVSALKRVEEELRASRQLLQTVFDVIPLWVFVKDRTRRFIMVNRRMADEKGVVPEEVAKAAPQVLSAALTAEQRARFEELDRRVLERGEAVEQPASDATLHNGETRRYRTLRVPLRNATGEITGIVGIAEDITDRERAQQALQQAQKLESLGVLAGGIAHDFNNLLVSVLGYAHLASMELTPDSPVQPLVRHIETAGRRASELCNQLLAYAGKGSFQVSRVHLNELIREMTELIRVSLSRNIHLQFDFAAELPDLEADATQLRQVVMNLVINASEAIGEQPGAITVRTGLRPLSAAALSQYVADADLPEGTYVYLEVADTGCGMDPEMLGRIFDPFFTTKFSGRGLGLAAVLGIVRGHRGALRVTSTPGRGTAFCILLPPGTPQPETAVERAPAPTFTGGGAVLVAEDEPAIRELVGLVLQPLGFTVTAVPDGAAALAAALELGAALRLVIMDVSMPGLSAEETLQRLRTAGVAAPVLIMSGHAESEVRDRFAGLPVSGFLLKPFTGKDVQVMLERILGAGPA